MGAVCGPGWCLWANIASFSRYTSDLVYARAAVYFMCAVISVFMLAYISRRFTSRSFVDKFLRKPESFVRYCVYRGFRVPFLACLSPNVGRMLVISAGIFFLSGKLLARYYYLRLQLISYNSPNLRAKAILLAKHQRSCFWWQSATCYQGRMDRSRASSLYNVSKFLTSTSEGHSNYENRALASKANFIAVLTGTSHEKLQVYL